MKVTKGEWLDGNTVNKDNGSLEYARNLAVSDDFTSSRNAFGFDPKLVLAGEGETLELVGKEVTNKGVAIFGNLYAGQRYAVIYLYDPEKNVAKTVLKTSKFNWSLDNPIRSSHTFNYKGDLVLIWCDGTTPTSNRPMILNVETPDIILNTNKEIVGNEECLYLFNTANSIDFRYSVSKNGILKGGAYYITASYELSDESVTNWSVIQGPIYIGNRTDKNSNSSIILNFKNLNTNYRYIKIGIILKSEGITTGKIYKKFSVSSNDLTIAVSDNTGDETDIREFTVRRAVYDKINDVIITNNKAYIASPLEYNNKLDYQKFANDIKVGYRYVTPTLTPNNPVVTSPTGGLDYKDLIHGGLGLIDNNTSYPAGSDSDQYYNGSNQGFMHGEVHAYYIFFVLKHSGHIVPAFHIPGRSAIENIHPSEVAHCHNPSLNGFHTNSFGKTIGKSFGCEQIPIMYFQNDLAVASPVVGKVEVTFTIGLIKCIIQFNTFNDFNSFNLANATTVNQNLWNNFSIYIENKFVIIKYTNINQVQEVTPITIDIVFNVNTPQAVNGNKYFVKLFDKKWMLHGGGYTHKEYLSYWENTNELYPEDDETYFPVGNVRHHRFPLMANSYKDDVVLGKGVDLLKPYFDNIYIPQELLNEISHIGIAQAKRTAINRTVWGQSPIHDITLQGDVEDNGNLTTDNIQVATRNWDYLYGQSIINNKSWYPNKKDIASMLSYTVDLKYITPKNGFNAMFRGLYKTKFLDIIYSESNIALTHLIPEYIEYIDYCANYGLLSTKLKAIVGSFSKTKLDAGLKPYYKNPYYKGVIEVLISKYIPNNSVVPLDYKDSYIANNTGDSFVYIESASADKTPNSDKSGWRSNSDNLMSATYEDDFTIDNDKGRVTRELYRFKPARLSPYNSLDSTTLSSTKPVGCKIVLATGYSKKDNVYYDFTNQPLTVIAIKPIKIAGYHSIGKDEDIIIGDTFKNVNDSITHKLTSNPHALINEDYFLNLTAFAKDKVYKDANIMSTPFFSESTVDTTKLYVEKDEILQVNINDVSDNFKRDFFKDLKPLYNPDYNSPQDIDVPIILSNFKINSYLYNAIAKSGIINDVKTNLANLKSFKANDIYYMPIENNEIVKMIGKGGNIYIQQRNALSLAMLKDRIEYKDNDVYLGTADLFDRAPFEIRDEEGGRISCEHFAHVCDHKFGITVVDTFKKAIYLVSGDKAGNISKVNMFNFFTNMFDTKINRSLPVNPFTGNGLFTILDKTGLLHVYNKTSFNHCYSIHKQCWFGRYDWFADLAFTYRDEVFSLKFDTLHKHNDRSKKGKFHVSSRNGSQPYYPTVVDIIFNAEIDKDKRLDSIIVNTTAQSFIDNEVTKNLYNETIDSVMVYTDTQCSGILPFELANIESSGYRMIQSKYIFNNFRDAVINDKLPFITSDKQVITGNVDATKKDWYERSVFINNYFVIRIVINNQYDYDKIINDVSLMVNSVKR